MFENDENEGRGMIAAATPTLSTKRVLIGVALSMLAHVVLLTAWRPAPQPGIAPPPVAAPIVLRLQPPAAPVAVMEAPVPPTRSKPAAPRRVIAVAPKAATVAAPALVVEAPPVEAQAPAPKKFDLEAARSTARVVGVQDAPNADDAPLGRLKKQQLEDQFQPASKAARAISAAKRGDCKDGLPGGLLAPLIMLTQKAGTGCKW
jgi:hypothetical protein